MLTRKSRALLFSAALAALAAGAANAAPARICGECLPRQTAEFVHRNSKWTALFSGHAGVTMNDVSIANVSTERGSQAMWLEDLDGFLAGNEFFGSKRPASAPDGLSLPEKQELYARIKRLAEFPIEYDAAHNNQKGEFFDEGGYYEFDCVGFVEHIFESLGYDLTDDSYESGFGWPLTVREQRDDSDAVHAY